MAHDDAERGVDLFAYAAMVPEVDLWLLEVCRGLEWSGRIHVTAADADVGYADEDIVRVCERGNRFVFEFSVLCAVKNYRWILHCDSCKYTNEVLFIESRVKGYFDVRRFGKTPGAQQAI